MRPPTTSHFHGVTMFWPTTLGQANNLHSSRYKFNIWNLNIWARKCLNNSKLFCLNSTNGGKHIVNSMLKWQEEMCRKNLLMVIITTLCSEHELKLTSIFWKKIISIDLHVGEKVSSYYRLNTYKTSWGVNVSRTNFRSSMYNLPHFLPRSYICCCPTLVSWPWGLPP